MKTETPTNIKSLKSNCDFIAILSQAPDGKTSEKGVEYRYYDADEDNDIIVEHTIISPEPLTKNDIRLLDYLLKHVDSENNVRVTGADLFGEFGYSSKLFDSVSAIQQLEMTDSIVNLNSRQSEEHRYKVIEYFTFADTRASTDWDSVGEDTIIRFKMFDKFVAVYVNHTIADLTVSIDDMIKANQRLVKAAAQEVDEMLVELRAERHPDA